VTGNGTAARRTSTVDYDVAVVGAGVAGSTAATLLGRAGLRVALIEKHRSIDTYKVLCTHTIHAAAVPTIRRLGLDRRIEAAGGVRAQYAGWTPWGWIVPPEAVSTGYNLRREKLDPLLRELAASTPGVELRTGQKVTGLIDDDGVVAGVRVQDARRREHSVRAGLVVGADGVRSTIARLSQASERVSPNSRRFFFAYFSGVELTGGAWSQFWSLGKATAYAFPNDDGVTLLAYFPAKTASGEFRVDREEALLHRLRELPDGPAMEAAEQESPVIASLDHPIISRSPIPVSGVALIGDAALTTDPTFGAGCDWAFRSGAWLADSVTEAMISGRPLSGALRSYRRRRRMIRGHHLFITRSAKAPSVTPLERLIVSAAARDSAAASEFVGFAHGLVPLRRLLGPSALVRALRVNHRGRGRQPTPQVLAGPPMTEP
jgi:menaquinone-9 beta-reductase